MAGLRLTGPQSSLSLLLIFKREKRGEDAVIFFRGRSLTAYKWYETIEDELGSQGKFWRRTARAREEWGEEAIRIYRFLDYRLMFDSKLSFSLTYDVICF